MRAQPPATTRSVALAALLSVSLRSKQETGAQRRAGLLALAQGEAAQTTPSVPGEVKEHEDDCHRSEFRLTVRRQSSMTKDRPSQQKKEDRQQQ